MIAFPLSVSDDGGDETSARFTGRTRWVYQELRDRKKVALFIDKLPEGLWEIRYELRAEVPGEFHALPVLAMPCMPPRSVATVKSSGVCVLDRETPTGKWEPLSPAAISSWCQTTNRRSESASHIRTWRRLGP